MTTQPALDLRYPTGKFEFKAGAPPEQFIRRIAKTPAKLRAAVAGLTPEQLETPYRPEGWTVRQVVHHVPESHMNAYIRFKWALTEESPRIKAYEESLWAQTPEVSVTPIEVSLALLECLHLRWVDLLKALRPADWQRTIDHPQNGTMTMERLLQIYAWHGPHHVAHVTSLRERMGW